MKVANLFPALPLRAIAPGRREDFEKLRVGGANPCSTKARRQTHVQPLARPRRGPAEPSRPPVRFPRSALLRKHHPRESPAGEIRAQPDSARTPSAGAGAWRDAHGWRPTPRVGGREGGSGATPSSPVRPPHPTPEHDLRGQLHPLAFPRNGSEERKPLALSKT